MLQWDEMHPYNAVHVARVPGILEAQRLQAGLSSALERAGLTRLVLDSWRHVYAYQDGPAPCEVKVLSQEPEATPALCAEVEWQLNTPFMPTPGFTPFRFFVMPATNSFFLGLVYFHPVADGEAIVHLLRTLLRDYLKPDHSALAKLDRYPQHQAHLLRRYPGVAARKVFAFAGQLRRLRQSHRPRYREAQNLHNGFSFIAMPPEHLCSLVAAAKDWEVTVNDLLLALLFQSVAPLTGQRLQAKKRRRISVGCIVNLRKELGMDRAQVFGLFLGSFIVTHPMPTGIGLRELAQDIRQQTLATKRHRLYLATPMELAVGRFLWRFFSPARRKKFYQKNYPLWAGLTNMNLNSLWQPSAEEGLIDYFRGVSTGPVTPLVFSVTTVGDHANVGLSYRSTVFSPQDIEQVQGHFVQHLEQLREQT